MSFGVYTASTQKYTFLTTQPIVSTTHCLSEYTLCDWPRRAPQVGVYTRAFREYTFCIHFALFGILFPIQGAGAYTPTDMRVLLQGVGAYTPTDMRVLLRSVCAGTWEYTLSPLRSIHTANAQPEYTPLYTTTTTTTTTTMAILLLLLLLLWLSRTASENRLRENSSSENVILPTFVRGGRPSKCNTPSENILPGFQAAWTYTPKLEPYSRLRLGHILPALATYTPANLDHTCTTLLIQFFWCTCSCYK